MVWNPDDKFKVDLIGSVLAVDQVVMSFQFIMTAGEDISDGNVTADFKLILSDLWDEIESIYSDEVVFTRVRVQAIPSLALVGESAYGTPLVGGDVGSLTAQQATLPVSFKTSIPNVILRKLLGPLGALALGATGAITAAAQAAAVAFAATLMDDLVGTIGVYEYGYLSPKTLSWEQPHVALVTAKPGSLRRRRLGQGS